MSLRAYRAALVEELRAQWKEDFRRILGEFFREIGLETPESRRELIARQMHVRIATKVKPPKPTKRSPRAPTCPRYVTAAVRVAVTVRDKGLCRYCRSEAAITLDHVLPWSRGGSNEAENVVLACEPCNYRKGQRTPAEAEMPLLPEPT